MAYVKTNWENNVTPINANNLNKIENELETLDQNIDDLNPVELWTNANPTSEFNNQTISFNATNYNKFDIICRLSTSNDLRICQTVYKNNMFRLMIAGYNTSDNMFIRDITINNSGATFGNCSGYGIGNNTTFTSTINNALIPLKIIGYK